MGILEDFKAVYNQLGPGKSGLIETIYTADVDFSDPAKHIVGIGPLKHYMQDLYAGVESCRFDFQEQVVGPGSAFTCWSMTLVHRKLRPGQPVTVRGASYLEFRDKIHLHRDYFDLGALIYERIPLLGGVVRGIKNRL